MTGFRERLEDDVLLGAEGYLFELERRGYLKSGPYVPEAVLDFPDAVRELHRELLRAGAEVMVAFTYYGHREKLRMIGREEDLEPLNRHALRLAKEVAVEGNALVAGNICNTWVYDPEAPDRSGEIVREMYREQVGWAVEEGADFIISETNDYLGEALIGLDVIQEFGRATERSTATSLPRPASGWRTEVLMSSASTARADRRRWYRSSTGSELQSSAPSLHSRCPTERRPADRPFRRCGTRTALGCFRSRSIRSCARASRWPTLPRQPETWASTTSASAAVALRTTSARWLSASVELSRQAVIPPTCRCIRFSGTTSRRRKGSSRTGRTDVGGLVGMSFGTACRCQKPPSPLSPART